jgi:hypothetical protein
LLDEIPAVGLHLRADIRRRAPTDDRFVDVVCGGRRQAVVRGLGQILGAGCKLGGFGIIRIERQGALQRLDRALGIAALEQHVAEPAVALGELGRSAHGTQQHCLSSHHVVLEQPSATFQHEQPAVFLIFGLGAHGHAARIAVAFGADQILGQRMSVFGPRLRTKPQESRVQTVAGVFGPRVLHVNRVHHIAGNLG